MDELREKYKWIVRILAIIFVGYLTFISFKAKAQTDTLYSIPISKARKLVQIALLSKACDSVVSAQEATIKAAVKQQVDSDSLLVIRTEQLKLTRLDMRDSVALVKIDLKEETRKRKRNGWARNLFIVTTGVLLWLIVKP